jgi:hypothetical protein
MKLKPQPRPHRRTTRTSRSGAARMGARPRGRMARRPGVPLRRRFAGRLPSIRRFLAGTAAVAAVAGLVAILNGPILRVTDVAWAGAAYTDAEALAAVLAPAEGRSVLAVDTRALREQLEALPSVAEADVSASLTGTVTAELVERDVAFIWQARGTKFLVADDGVVFAVLDRGAPVPDTLVGTPRVFDERHIGRSIRVGTTIAGSLVDPTLDILAIDPVALGSSTGRLQVHLDDEFGFRLVSDDPAWEVALGVYGTNPRETALDVAARLERQVTAVRTLFATRDEDRIGWVDVRNPGKVYFRAGG